MLHDWFIFPRPEPDDDRAPRPPVRLRFGRIAVALVALVVLGSGGYALYHQAMRWNDERNAQLARTYLEQQDYRRAQLILEQAVQVNPGSLAARRALAAFYDQAGSPLALTRWRELVALSPDDDSVKLRLAATALRFGEIAELRAALAGVSPAGHQTLDYHRFAAGLALVQGDAPELQRQLAAMAQLEPANLGTRVSLASLRLRSPVPVEAAAARTELEQLARGDLARIHATLSLLLALPAADSAAVSALAQRLVPGNLSALGGTPGWSELIRHMQAQPHPSADDAAALLNCMGQHDLAREALTWADTLEPATRTAPVMLVAQAQAALRLREWRVLRQRVADGAWGWVNADVVDLAFAARLQRERTGLVNSRATWDDALKLAQASPTDLRVLLRLADELGWPEETSRTLETIVRTQPRDSAAWAALVAGAEARGETETVWKFYRDWTRAQPDNAAARARRALLGVVLERVDDTLRADLRTAELQTQPAAIAARALLQWRTGDQAGAQAAVAGLGNAALQNPRVALVAGLILADTGERAAATRLLALVAPTVLLPEERVLLRTAQARNGDAVAPKP